MRAAAASLPRPLPAAPTSSGDGPGRAGELPPAGAADGLPSLRAPRLLRRLERRIAAAPSPRAADPLRCERAGYLARCGDLDGARTVVAEVRDRHAAASRPSLRTSIALHVADALIAESSNLGARAHDRLARAYALASAASLRSAQAVGAAWWAQIELQRGRPLAAARLAAEALVLAAPDRRVALGRASLVVAQAYHEAERLDLARRWYDAARRQATEDADGPALSAVLRTMARLRLANWRLARQFADRAAPAGSAANRPPGLGPGTGSEDADASIVRTSLASSRHFDALIGIDAPPGWHARLEFQWLAECGRVGDALALDPAVPVDDASARIEALPHEAVDVAGVDGLRLADRAWCLHAAGRCDDALLAADDAAATLSRPGLAADRALAHVRLAGIYDALGERSPSAVQRRHADRARDELRAHRAGLVDAFDAALAETVIV